MGFFSWLTADTKESVGNEFSSNPHSKKGPVYLLQPGKEAIVEDAYEGYGRFGGIDAYVWLAVHNMDVADILRTASLPDKLSDTISRHIATPGGMDILIADHGLDELFLDHVEDVLRSAAISEYVGGAIINISTGERLQRGQNGVPNSWDEPVESLGGKSLNDARNDGLIRKMPIEPDFPLKFSFNKDADYQKLGLSEICPNQGYFFPAPANKSNPSPPAPRP